MDAWTVRGKSQALVLVESLADCENLGGLLESFPVSVSPALNGSGNVCPAFPEQMEIMQTPV